MDIRIQSCKVWAGHRECGGRIHGSHWKPLWEVVLTFETQEDAEKFAQEITRDSWYEVTQEIAKGK